MKPDKSRKTSPSTPRYIVDESGARISVVLPIADYEELLEDIADLASAAERRGEKAADHDAVVQRLKADGLL